ncbi:hypothetical protein GN958_ATG12737 [Phytophthora infestans]|uniref:Uncharacterized protein n=1 Tax=Phytophthora infestans TaxID=4787 RepID=A0A8S9UI12_PHYIN|nr:hypothetical protein GN958_ATG12737 [Phytophthora infestans]
MKDVPKSKAKYSYYTCKHCTLAYSKDPDLDQPELLLACSYNYHIGPSWRAVEGSQATVVARAHDHLAGKRSANKRLGFSKVSPKHNTSKRASPRAKSHRRYSKLEKQKLERLLAEFQVDFLPDLFIERSRTKALLEY